MKPELIKPSDIVGENVEGESVFARSLFDAFGEIQKDLALKTVTGAWSDAFVSQLAMSCCRLELPFRDKQILIAYGNVIDRVAELEKAAPIRTTNMKKPACLKEGMIKGLWHAHFLQPNLFLNLLMEIQRPESEEIISEEVNKVSNSSDALNTDLGELYARICHGITIELLETRAGSSRRNKNKRYQKKRVTGEWIVYAKTKTRNIYLTIGVHGEDSKGVYARARLALEKFPELKKMEPFVSEEAGWGVNLPDGG